MKTFVVGYYSLFNNVMYLEKVKASNEIEAYTKHSKSPFTFNEKEESNKIVIRDDTTLDFIEEICFNCETAMSVLEV